MLFRAQKFSLDAPPLETPAGVSENPPDPPRPPPPSTVVAHYAYFSANYIHSWDHV